MPGASLVSRVLTHLYTGGPDYARAIAEALGAPVRESAVSGALADLKRRGLVTASRDGHRVYYAADVDAMAGAVAAIAADLPLAPAVGERDILERLDDEIALLRLEQRIDGQGVDVDVLIAMADDPAEPARHRRVA